MHELTSVEEMKRLYGPLVEEAIKVDVPGMEIGTQHKYALNILLDAMGHPHSEAPRVTERFRRTDFGHLDVQMTFEDPETYTKPLTIKVPHTLLADQDIFEMFCENGKDRVHLQNANPRR